MIRSPNALIRGLTIACMLAGASLSAGAAEPLVVGQIASTSNPLVAGISTQYNKGITLAFDRANGNYEAAVVTRWRSR